MFNTKKEIYSYLNEKDKVSELERQTNNPSEDLILDLANSLIKFISKYLSVDITKLDNSKKIELLKELVLLQDEVRFLVIHRSDARTEINEQLTLMEQVLDSLVSVVVMM